MCGITGFLTAKHDIGREVLEEMTLCLQHRGPDDSGTFAENGCGLGHRRLSILDLSAAGHQPMFSADGQVVLVFNGEIYNFRELRREIEAQDNVPFRSNSDTEVVLRAFLAYGDACFAKLDGMFALAIYDRRSQQLYLARDRFGIKPLYYFETQGSLVFASEIKSILKVPSVPRQLNWQGFHEYLYFGTTLGETTFFRSIKRLLPGRLLKFSLSEQQLSCFHDVLDVEPASPNYADAVVQVRQLADQAVQRHLLSDVPVGVFLSGGIDSALVTAIASQHYGGQLATFTAAFDFCPEANEFDNAKFVANTFGTKHTELMIRGADVANDLQALVKLHDAPFGDIANLPLYLMCRQLDGQIKVVLQGDGGDEMFAGYHRYSRLQQARLWRNITGPLFWFRRLIPKNSTAFRALRTFHAFRQPPPLQMAWLMSQEFFDFLPESVLTEPSRQALRDSDPFKVYQERYHRLAQLDPVQQMLYTDATVILPDLYFEKVDRATMGCSIEVRVPMVDNALATYAMSLPANFKVSQGNTKKILKDAARGIVPDRILDGKKKGLYVPFRQWLRGPLKDFMCSVLLDPRVIESGVLDRDRVNSCIERHVSGQRDHGFLLYKLLNFGLWLQEYDPTC